MKTKKIRPDVTASVSLKNRDAVRMARGPTLQPKKNLKKVRRPLG